MAVVARSLLLPEPVWSRLTRLQRRDRLASLDAAVEKAIAAGTAAFARDDGPRSPRSTFFNPLTRSTTNRLLIEAGLEELGVGKQPKRFGGHL